ncbi:polysialyltransferase family glycosyltransferase [uncultured Aquabacterium sp.]|uniref:polysialyltransferase family glycosyltransferase n=1 Tax=uncultured Aquabacterium sp. TaxID=158753 RepID=UPI0025DD8064|nr:polysialyltransferase family glycosyltransferase [uncultured Aquabacterium sp.]
MSDYFVYNGPLQYFLCKLIADERGLHNAVGIQYTDCGDFASVFSEIDALLGGRKFDSLRFSSGSRFDFSPEDSVFLSNRFNPSEVEIYLAAKRRSSRICGFEDGLALYLPHSFKHPSWNDGNKYIVAKNITKTFLRKVGVSGVGLPSYFPLSGFDAFYSMFENIPGKEVSIPWYDLKPALRAIRDRSPERGELSGSLILSQSLVTDGLAAEATYLKFLKSLVHRLTSSGETVYFKPHPRDPVSVQELVNSIPGCRPLPEEFKRVPVEIFVAMNPEVELYGFWSSALAYSSGVFQQRSYSFAQVFFDSFDGDGDVAVRAVWDSVRPILEGCGVQLMR